MLLGKSKLYRILLGSYRCQIVFYKASASPYCNTFTITHSKNTISQFSREMVNLFPIGVSIYHSSAPPAMCMCRAFSSRGLSLIDWSNPLGLTCKERLKCLCNLPAISILLHPDSSLQANKSELAHLNSCASNLQEYCYPCNTWMS